MLSSTESELKAKATKYFQEFRMDEAIDYYNRALKQANSDTCVLNSNISACYFEKGEYQTCIDYSKKVLDDAAVFKKSFRRRCRSIESQNIGEE